VVALIGGKALRLSCWFVSGQDTTKREARVHDWSSDKGV
jgi:hypothetical protein